MLEIFVQYDPSEFLLICCSKCLSGTSDNLRSNVFLRISPDSFWWGGNSFYTTQYLHHI